MVKFITLYDNKRDVIVKTKEGILTFENYNWYFCIEQKDAKQNREILKELKRVHYIEKFEVEGDYVKIFCHYLERERVLQNIKGNGIKTYEDDLKPFQRYLVDEDLELDVDQSVLYFDIETSDLKKGINPGEEQILSIAAIGSDKKKYYFVQDNSTDEKELLEGFLKLIPKYDILAGWNSEGFDLVAITKRCELHELRIPCWVAKRTAEDLGGLDNVRRMGQFRARPTQLLSSLDLMMKMKEMHYRDTELIKKVRSFSLSAVSKVILGRDKVDLKGQSIYYLWKDQPEKLKEYNFGDVQLLVDLDKKLNITRQKLIEHQVCCARLNDYTSHGKIDIFALKGAKKLGKRLPSKPDKVEDEPRRDDDRGKTKGDYIGGFVFEPITGLYKDVYIFDFSSLYPSIIKTFNISIDSLADRSDENAITLPTGIKFSRTEIGIIPSIIQDVVDQRNKIRHVDMKKVPKESFEYMNLHYRQYAFKVLANSMYGIMGAKFSRYYKRELAEGITLTGQYLLKYTWSWFKMKELTPIYGDSDSIFLVSDKKIETDELIKELNDHLRKHLTETFNIKDCQIQMDFKGLYPRFIMLDKKKYVGVNDSGEIEMTGVEAKKRDTLPKAEEWQRDILHMLLKIHVLSNTCQVMRRQDSN